jgi:succinate dehydrogenase / fumarate reductase, membrane anchor subunit
MADKSFRSMRTPLARVRGLGSAKEGVHHWWAQRLTALALVPLTLWFVVSVAGLAGMDHAGAVAWIGSPPVTVLLVLLIAATFWHAQLGVQVVIEDYVHSEAVKLVALIAVKFAAVLLAIASIFAVLRLAFGG